MSPVSSRTQKLQRGESLAESATTSCARAFIGAKHIAFTPARSRTPSRTCVETSWSSVSIATLVLPAPVGAHIKRFSDVWNADSNTTDWSRLSLVMCGGNAARAHEGQRLVEDDELDLVGLRGEARVRRGRHDHLLVAGPVESLGPRRQPAPFVAPLGAASATPSVAPRGASARSFWRPSERSVSR